MGKSFEDLTDNEKKFLKSVLGEGKKTDTEIAEETDLSVSTVNRIRHSFEDQDIIKDYISVIDLEGVSIQLYSLLTLKLDEERSAEDLNTQKLIFAGKTDEAQPEYTILLGHTDYQDYRQTTKKLKDSLKETEEIKTQKLLPNPDTENFVLRGRTNI